MSYDNQDPGAYLDLLTNVGGIQSAWFRMLDYTQTVNFFIRLTTSFDEAITGQNFSNQTELRLITDNNGETPFVTGSNTNWIYCCQVTTIGVGVTLYYRFEGATSLSSVSIAAVDETPSYTELALIVGQFGNAGHMRMSLFRQYTSASSLTPTQILAESASTTPIVTANLNCTMSCAFGSTVGQDTSGSGNNFTVLGTITTNVDEPNIAITPAGSAVGVAGIHYVTA